MKPWEAWVPSRKVTAGAFAAACSFVIVLLGNHWLGLTAAEAVAAGSALTVIIAYLIPERP